MVELLETRRAAQDGAGVGLELLEVLPIGAQCVGREVALPFEVAQEGFNLALHRG